MGILTILKESGYAVEPRDRDDDCPVCGSRRLVAFARGPRWTARCAECGLVCAYPQADDDELAAVYDDAYYDRFGFFGDAGEACHAMKQAGFDRLLQNAECLVPPGRLLDVGCGLGDMLVTATRRGWDATGVEPHGDARHVACCLPDATIHQCAFEDYRSDEPFGLITCIDVLEHLRRPDDALAHMAELLHPGGVVMITTIDVKGLGANVLGTRWPHFHRDHLWYFDRRSLQRLAEKAGLHVVSCNRAKKCFQLDYLLRIMSHAEMFPTGQRCARLGLSLLPRWLRTRRFVLPEGLLLVARKPPGTTAQR